MDQRKLSAFLLTVLFLIGILIAGCNNRMTKVTQITANTSDVKYNKGKIWREQQAGWPKPPLFQGNPYGAGGIGTAWTFTMEGLYQWVRSTDKIYPRLAIDMPKDEGNKTIIKLRKGVTWNDGKPFTSKDVWAYYILNNGAFICKFLKSVEIPDDYTVIFTWNDPQPNPRVKQLLIAMDWQATIPYHIYGKYVDKAAELLKSAKPAQDIDKRGAFGLYIDQHLSDELSKNWQEFTKCSPKYPIGTGAFKVVNVTPSHMILKKRPDYWNAKNVKFEEVDLVQMPDQAQQYAMYKTGKYDRGDGTPPKDIIENLLSSNKDLIHYQMFDSSGDFGFVFNIKKPPFDDVRFRRALIYAFDKTKIREVGNYYGKETIGYSIMAMPLSMIKDWVLPEVQEKMTKYKYDPEKAAQLLKEIGWTKGSDGIWRDKNGKVYNFIIGTAGYYALGPAAEICAEQLTKFGMPTKALYVDGTVYWDNAQSKHLYDMSTDWIDANWGPITVPYWALSNFYWGFAKNAGNFPVVEKGPNKGQLNMILPGSDGKLVDIDKVLKKMLYMNDEEMKKAASDLVWIANENAFGLDWFQNVTGTWFNMKTTKMRGGWPMQDLIKKYNRNMPLPTDPEDAERIAETNLGFAGIQMVVDGDFMPN
ncbi:peptide/nickel transport system substrate-binding protein [Caldanaerobius fijiensis DSM 17918]|uniref:Peptide/nickel transport system substrate-binding protein n=1 Tax=Caldanaerobius fijiensis DSM 17918 TaxID=1121256 RepID=A0A1M5BC91_9THEO|nr:ABC transporter substrate-binding protein [Caldanaerobius fijiensis]SHF40153.1 peptide/nickel transport system substrate-binding protein [Caldanaerobius fijiensis DSM 17918]